MKANDIRLKAKQAVDNQDWPLALEVCKALLDDNIFIGDKAPKDTSFNGDLTRILTYTGRCNSCGLAIPKDTKAVWIKGAGVWHEGCR